MRDIKVDCLLGTVGLLPREITSRQALAALAMEDKFDRRARAWWKRTERAKFVEPTARDLDKLFDKVATEPSQDDLEAWLREAGDETEIIEDTYLALKDARKYLVEKWPRIQIQTFAGTRLAALSVDDTAEITSLWAVLNDPERVLDEMDAGTLSPSQATAFRKCYPYLYDHYRSAIFDGAAEMAMRDREWVPDETQEVQLAVLTGQPSGALPYQADSEQEKPPKAEADLGAANAQTQADKSAKPKGT